MAGTYGEKVELENSGTPDNYIVYTAYPGDLVTMVDHNLIDGYRGYDGETQGNDHVAGNPGFVDPANGDFHLQNNSPVIDRGSADKAPDTDFSGIPRPKGAGHDIGAFEL